MTKKTHVAFGLLTATAVMVAFCFSSCKLMLRMSGTYKKPVAESRENVLSYIHSKNAVTDAVFSCRSEGDYRYFIDSVNNSIPWILVFDRNFKNMYTDTKCSWSASRSLDSLENSAGWKLNEKLSFTAMLQRMDLLEGKLPVQDNGEPYDFYVFYTWAIFVPRLSNSMIGEISNYKSKTGDKVFVGAINLDLQKDWK